MSASCPQSSGGVCCCCCCCLVMCICCRCNSRHKSHRHKSRGAERGEAERINFCCIYLSSRFTEELRRLCIFRRRKPTLERLTGITYVYLYLADNLATCEHDNAQRRAAREDYRRRRRGGGVERASCEHKLIEHCTF